MFFENIKACSNFKLRITNVKREIKLSQVLQREVKRKIISLVAIEVCTPIEDFEDASITAPISIRLPLDLINDLKKLALNEEHERRYEVLIRDILEAYTAKNKPKKETPGVRKIGWAAEL